MNEKTGLKLSKQKENNKENNEYQKEIKQISDSIITNTESDFQFQNSNNCIKTVQIFITEFGFLFLILLIFLISYLIPEYHSSKIFESKQNLEFNHDPIILVHTTDLHISIKREGRTDSSTLFMMSLCEYNPDLVLMTGDYIDNFKKKQHFGFQNLKE